MGTNPISITAIPAFSDNYIWLIEGGGPACAVVDPGDHAPVLAALEEKGLELRHILLTHHHPDHVGGVTAVGSVGGSVRHTRIAEVQGIDGLFGDGFTLAAWGDEGPDLQQPELHVRNNFV